MCAQGFVARGLYLDDWLVDVFCPHSHSHQLRTILQHELARGRWLLQKLEICTLFLCPQRYSMVRHWAFWSAVCSDSRPGWPRSWSWSWWLLISPVSYRPAQHQENWLKKAAEFMFRMKWSQYGSRQMYREFAEYCTDYLDQIQSNKDTTGTTASTTSNDRSIVIAKYPKRSNLTTCSHVYPLPSPIYYPFSRSFQR